MGRLILLALNRISLSQEPKTQFLPLCASPLMRLLAAVAAGRRQQLAVASLEGSVQVVVVVVGLRSSSQVAGAGLGAAAAAARQQTLLAALAELEAAVEAHLSVMPQGMAVQAS